MRAHQQRVVDEKAELDERLRKLREFIHSSPIFGLLPGPERDRLHRQQTAMEAYSGILGERIEAFELGRTIESGDACPRCGGDMKPGVAIAQTYAGSEDFPGGGVVTMSPGGPGRMTECMKCESCGHSVEK